MHCEIALSVWTRFHCAANISWAFLNSFGDLLSDGEGTELQLGSRRSGFGCASGFVVNLVGAE